MCSNCSGDDLRPESFASFGVSSPDGGRVFAGLAGGKRKRYGTSSVWAMLTRGALTLGVSSKQADTWRREIIDNVNRRSFVNLNLESAHGENMEKVRPPSEAKELVDIRVSSCAIIEVFRASGKPEESRTKYELHEKKYLSAWEESFAERSDLKRSMNRVWRARRLDYFVACGAFVTVAALAVWCALR